MIFHARFIEQLITDIKIAFIKRAPVGREGRACDGKIGAQCIEKRIIDRADIAGVGGIEGRAVFEKELLGASRSQPVEGGDGLADGYCQRKLVFDGTLAFS